MNIPREWRISPFTEPSGDLKKGRNSRHGPWMRSLLWRRSKCNSLYLAQTYQVTTKSNSGTCAREETLVLEYYAFGPEWVQIVAMGWWPWGSSNDLVTELDPSLREYLKDQTPTHPTTSRQTSTQGRAATSVTRPSEPVKTPAPPASQPTTQEVKSTTAEKPLPAESLFQDGRYKSIWATFRPQNEMEAAVKSDEEKLSDIIDAYKERQAEVKSAAIENCAGEQLAIHECFKSGSWSALMTLCREENRAFNRCVVMQARFLRALGFMSMWQRTDEETERLQMHADKLYHRMLDQEKVQMEAKERGEEPPEFPPLLQAVERLPNATQHSREHASTTGTSEYKDTPSALRSPETSIYDSLPKQMQDKVTKEHFQGLQGAELELAKQEFNQQMAFNRHALHQLSDQHMTAHRQRLERLHRGEEHYSDKIMRWLDFRKYPEDNEKQE